MPNRRVKPKRNKVLVLLLLPVLIFIGVMGWLLYSLSPTNRRVQKTIYQAPKVQSKADDGVTFIPAVYEEHSEVLKN
jgi:CHASE3 domain sensor protein